jgi:hypothetical protein
MQPNSGADGCIVCEDNFYSNPGATSCLNCPIGKFSVEGWGYCLFLPTSIPTTQPTSIPTTQPTSIPTTQPTSIPTTLPTSQPTGFPTSQPTGFPTSQPTGFPTSQPTGFPTSQPTGFPTSQPTGFPTSQPTCHPSPIPTILPTKSQKSLSSNNFNSINQQYTYITMIISLSLICFCGICISLYMVYKRKKNREHLTPYEKWLAHYEKNNSEHSGTTSPPPPLHENPLHNPEYQTDSVNNSNYNNIYSTTNPLYKNKRTQRFPRRSYSQNRDSTSKRHITRNNSLNNYPSFDSIYDNHDKRTAFHNPLHDS